MQFRDITGHKDEIKKLTALVDSGKIPHALLLHGPSGVGKTAVARAFVQYIGCTDRRDGDSCGRCPACLQTARLNNPDVHYIYPVVKGDFSVQLSANFIDEWKEYIEKYPYMPTEQWLEMINAGNSRPSILVPESEEIIRQASLSSYGDGLKTFFVWLPEKLNPAAANKLLKVIEEPFDDTLFVLVSNNPGEIISTIRSRLQDVEFKPLADADISGYLMTRGKSAEEAASLARIARGNMNKAFMLMENDGEMAQFRSDFIAVMRACYARKMTELRSYAETFAAYGREKSMRLLDYFARMIRESFISNLRCAPLESMTPEEKAFVAKFGPFINSANVEDMAREVDRAREDISRNANQKIVWFDLFIEFTRLIRTKGVKQASNSQEIHN